MKLILKKCTILVMIKLLKALALFFSTKTIAVIPDRCDWQDCGSSESPSIIAIIIFIIIVVIMFNAKTK